MKKIFIIAIVILISIGYVSATSEYIPCRDYIYGIQVMDMTIDELEEAMSKEKEKMDNFHYKAEELRSLGYTDESSKIQELKEKYWISFNLYREYKKQYDKLSLEDEYPTATYVWKYLKDLGYNDYVCAGILGNMMMECGGGTLELQWDIYDLYGDYYGLCQWSKYYFPDVQGANLEEQMVFLEDTIEEQINYAGCAYGGQGFGYENFLELTDEYEAAICFAKAYERCAPEYVYSRGYFAQIAYEYFTN